MSRWEAAWKGLVVAAAGVAVAACATASWTKPDATEAQLQQDLTACHAEANAAVETRYGRQIPRHTDDLGGNPYQGQGLGGGPSFNTMMVRNEAIRAGDRMVADCMRSRGYAWGRSRAGAAK